MTGTALVLARAGEGFAWELRAAWGSGRRVALTLSEHCAPLSRVEGHVSGVAATGAYVTVAGWQVPLTEVLAVHLPSRLGDSTVRDAAFHGEGRRTVPQLEALW